MQNKETYEYAIIRLVPKVERAEFLNIGVILFSKRYKFLDMKYHLDQQKMEICAPEIDFDMIDAYLKAWKSVCKGAPDGGKIGQMEIASRFRWLVASRSTIIQSSSTHTGLCTDPQLVMEKLFIRNVL